MKNIIFTLFYIGITIGNAWADEPRNQTVIRSRNEQFTFKLKKNNWNMTDSKGNLLYSIPEKGFAAMSVFITNDGKNVVVMDDLISGGKITKKTALRFFHEGKQVMSYSLTDLVKDSCNIIRTGQYVKWTLEDFDLAKNDSTFSLATFEFNEIDFNTNTGQIVKNAKPFTVDRNTYILRGKFYKSSSSDKTEMLVRKYILGDKLPFDTIHFSTDMYTKGNWDQVVVIKDGIDVTPIRFRGEVFGDGCLIN
ncbi:hypothetical protein [Cellulophaga sp. BC115SP]|uniref:hypothetical protein n=1 Tax=Cellulophaga sp. BC115SP TaxID=2683263 RepID=UPI0014136823|nr:hypothetical protein [Cellulophaga sp. BC115SP]NBB30060.1 hypothetical protein [Cellulophaga sp. BC115SP]